MILAKVQMPFLSGPNFTDVETVDSCPRYSLYVCMSVCNIRPALTTPTNFLKFGMKVGDH